MSGDLQLVGGRERREIVLVEHDPAWTRRFSVLRELLVTALADVAIRVEHIGSTAVPGLAAKPIIDMQVAVPDPDQEEPLAAPLQRLGYEIRVREPGHRMFRTLARDVHVHVWRAGGTDERRHLLFRDWLRHTREDRQRYEEVKRSLSARPWEDMNEYAAAKTAVIAELLERAERWAATGEWAFPPPAEMVR